MRQFLQQTFASLIGSLAATLLFFTLGASSLLLLVIAATSTDQESKLKQKSVLVFDLSTSVKDTKRPATLGEAFSLESTKTMTLQQVLKSIDKAAVDRNIVGILLDGSSEQVNTTGYATLQEIRSALVKFRETGKRIVAYDVNWGEKEYYLGSVANTIMLNPMGVMELNGLSSEPLFLAAALEKFGIGVQTIRVGKFKSAVEPFIQQNLSSENRQQTKQLLWNIWSNFLNTVSQSRDLTPQKLQNLAGQKGLLLPKEALAFGLVDEVIYYDEVVGQLKQLTDSSDEDESFNQVSLYDYSDDYATIGTETFSRNKIALIYAEGSIVSGEGSFQEIGADSFVKELRQLRRDKNVKAVVLRVNSPGGSATASEIILREVQLTSKEKPVIVSMGDMAASGGYWIATGGDHIFAEVNTVTGSIGVFGLLFNFQELAKNNGITWDVVKTSGLANLNTVARPKTAQELALYQRLVDDVYNKFLDKVAESRKLPREKVAEIAQGRVWSGEDAKEIGLVDQIGGIKAAIEYAAGEAQLEDDWTIEEYPQPGGFELGIFDYLLSKQAKQSPQSIDPLTSQFLQLRHELFELQNLNDPKGVYTRLPFHFKLD